MTPCFDMEAPKKIYVNIGPRQSLITRAGQTLKSDIEYIRKDALLEWAKKKNKRIDTEDGDYSLGYVSAMIDLIDKIESL